MNTDTRNAILTAARKRFSDQGYHQTSVSDIIRDVGMAQGSFYNYFDNKRAIFAEVLARTCEEIAARVEAVSFSDVTDKETYAHVGLKLAQSLVAYFLEHKQQARLFLWDSVGLDADANHQIEAAYNRIAAYSAAYLKHGQQLGIVRQELLPDVVAHGLVGMCAHLTKHVLTGGFQKLSLGKVVNTIYSTHLHGIFA